MCETCKSCKDSGCDWCDPVIGNKNSFYLNVETEKKYCSFCHDYGFSPSGNYVQLGV